MNDEILLEIQKLSDKRRMLYLELDRIIHAGGEHLGFAQPQVQEIHTINSELIRLWSEERARGRFWMPRLRQASRQEKYERPLRRGIHGYGS